MAIDTRTFADGLGTGTGNLKGATERLEHLEYMRQKAVWISPHHPYGGKDAGYDISDYYAVNPTFGTMDDFERFVDDWTAAVDHGDAWVPKVYAMKWHAVEAAKRVVDRALDVSGGAGMFRSSELERLYRDVRCGGFHPGNDALTHEMVGKIALGIADEPQRW